MPETYTCAICGRIFEKTWSDDEAIAEMQFFFGQVTESERAIICDDCYQKIHPAEHSKEIREAIRKLKGDA